MQLRRWSPPGAGKRPEGRRGDARAAGHEFGPRSAQGQEFRSRSATGRVSGATGGAGGSAQRRRGGAGAGAGTAHLDGATRDENQHFKRETSKPGGARGRAPGTQREHPAQRGGARGRAPRTPGGARGRAPGEPGGARGRAPGANTDAECEQNQLARKVGLDHQAP